ncbi:MAG: Na+/H+ antiporter [Anaerolineales bacterium]
MAPFATQNSRYRTLILVLLLSILTACSTMSNPFSTDIPHDESSIAEDEIHIIAEDSNVIFIEEVVIGLLLIAIIVGIITRRLRLPYTVGLVLIGLALSVRGQTDVNIPPELFLGLLVPPLIFEAAFHLNVRDLRYDLAPILALAIPGVLITTGLVGLVVATGTGAPITLTLVFGALIAATDPVAVVALFRSLGVPKRLQGLLEGESLFNDGTAIVVFNMMIAIAITGSFSLVASLLDFAIVSGGGIGIGLILGMIYSQITRRIDDPLIETTLTAVLAFGAYLVAEEIHVSGVLAVVAAGLIAGNVGPRGMSPSTRVLVFNFWEIMAFLANSLVFLLIGLQINLFSLFDNWQVIMWAIFAVLAARMVSVYGLSWLGKGIPTNYKHVLFWGGLRGAISLALAISLPSSLGPLRSDIQAMAFGVVLFTLLFQGLTMRPLIRKMGLINRWEHQDEYERRHAISVMAKAAFERLDAMKNNGILSEHVWESLSPLLTDHVAKTTKAVRNFMHDNPEVEFEEYETARRESLTQQRSTLSTLLRDGIISEEVFSDLATEIDQAQTDTHINWLEATHQADPKSITELIVFVIQEEDLQNAIETLTNINIPFVRMPSAGEFLNRRNATLLITIHQENKELIIKTLRESVKERVAVLHSPNQAATGQTVPTEVTVGATLFSFEIERYEEF